MRPFGSSPITISGIRYRHFSSSTSAFRLNAFLGYNAEWDIKQQKDTDRDLEELKTSEDEFTVSLRPGFEKHLPGTERLSPYFGGDFGLTLRSISIKEEFQIDNKVEHQKLQNGEVEVAFNVVMGFDFYFSKNIYLGAELGTGFAIVNRLNSRLKHSNKDVWGEDPEPIKNGGSFSFGPNVETGFRPGYLF